MKWQLLSLPCHAALLWLAVVSGWAGPTNTRGSPLVVRSVGFPGLPVLSYLDASTGVNVTLIGVSHGALTSAQLVSAVTDRVKPSAIVVELCEERWASISLEARIRPRGDQAMEAMFDNKVVLLDAQDDMLRQQPFKYLLHRAAAVLNFVRAQGPIGGIFVLLGLTVNALQRATRSKTGKDSHTNDEFVTAMQAAEKLNVPLLLGDAPQADTLKSLRRVLSLDVFKSRLVLEGVRALRFSVLGVGAPALVVGRGDGMKDVEQSQFISIPQTYMKNRAMLVGLAPILLIYMATIALGLVAGAVEGASDPSLVETSGPAFSLLSTLNLPEVPESLGQVVDTAVGATIDVLSLLFLVRFSTIIGTERDKIIADKVRTFCQGYTPGSSIVLVIGMLHVNGVALRGIEPGSGSTSGIVPVRSTD